MSRSHAPNAVQGCGERGTGRACTARLGVWVCLRLGSLIAPPFTFFGSCWAGVCRRRSRMHAHARVLALTRRHNVVARHADAFPNVMQSCFPFLCVWVCECVGEWVHVYSSGRGGGGGEEEDGCAMEFERVRAR